MMQAALNDHRRPSSLPFAIIIIIVIIVI